MKEDTMTDRDVCISIGKIEDETQVTSNDTGWSEEKKERMRQYGYDDMDIIREGVPCRPFMLNVGEVKDEKDDRLLYWDAHLPLPQWQEGAKLWVSTFDKSVCDWRLEG